jgi:hypothetical protein
MIPPTAILGHPCRGSTPGRPGAASKPSPSQRRRLSVLVEEGAQAHAAAVGRGVLASEAACVGQFGWVEDSVSEELHAPADEGEMRVGDVSRRGVPDRARFIAG